jgi:hypothetical protein
MSVPTTILVHAAPGSAQRERQRAHGAQSGAQDVTFVAIYLSAAIGANDRNARYINDLRGLALPLLVGGRALWL